jgi:hypothetical protein
MPSAPKLQAPQGQPLFDVQFRAISESLAGNGVLSNGDLEVTAGTNAMEIDVAAGTAYYLATEYTYGGAAPAATLSTGDGTDDRWDTVAFDTATTSVTVYEGTPELYPTADDIQGDELLLAIVYVPAGATDIDNSNILNWRAKFSNEAEEVHYDDDTGVYGVSNVDAALDELQEAAQISAYPLAIGDLDSPYAPASIANVNGYPFQNGDLANDTITANAGTGLTTTNAAIGLGGSATIAVDTITSSEITDGTILDADISGTTTIARGKLDDERATTSVSTNTTTSGEEVLLVDTSGGAVTITLASADLATGNVVAIVDVGGAAASNAITVDTEGGEGIDGGTSTTVDSDYGATVVVGDAGSGQWYTSGGGGSGSGVTNETIVADDSGSVAAGNLGTVYLTSVPDGGTIEVTQAYLTLADGQPAPTGCDLIIATLAGDGTGTSQTTLISGDGATVYDDETGEPVGSYANTSGAAQTAALGVDNGNFNSGSGSSQDIAAGGIGEVI